VSSTPRNTSLTVSIVSHGHGAMVTDLLRDLAGCGEVTRIILTHNVPEPGVQIDSDLAARTTVITNPRPVGFSANHNAAFRRSDTDAFCVMNPDIRLQYSPFRSLLALLHDPSIGVVAPAVLSPGGSLECTARRFPTPSSVLLKAFGQGEGGIQFELGAGPVRPDWVAGMFLLLRSDAFAAVGGLDERFTLYYEDVDLCVRLRKAGYDVVLSPSTAVIHDARRRSHRNPRYMAWHLQSMMRYFATHIGRLPVRPSTT
jgi:N-acetylglucosaminyl-diphospho-decaprenol L-rhamnosyltransferase